MAKRARELGIRSIPAVAIDGKLGDCCAGRGIDPDVLRARLAGTAHGVEDWREDPRLDINGEALWSAGRVEGSCRLLNLSAGGVGIVDPRPALQLGTHLRATLLVEGVRLESIPVEVVRGSEEGLALRFASVSKELRAQIEQLIYDLRGAV